MNISTRFRTLFVLLLGLNIGLQAQICPGECPGYVEFIDVDNQPDCTGPQPLQFTGNIDNNSTCEDSYGDNCYRWVFIKSDTSTVTSIETQIGEGSGCNGEADNFYSMVNGECKELGSIGSQNTFTFHFGIHDTLDVWICDGSSGEVSLCEVCILRTPLPVEYGNFEVSLVNNGVQINWSTLSEVNNEGFVVQKRYEDSDWMDLTFIHGSGNSNIKNEYSYIDRTLNLSNRVIYRLKQVDYDGNFKYSEEQAVLINNNPVDLQEAIRYGQYYNMLGQPVSEQKGLVVIHYKGRTYKLYIKE